MTYNYDDILLKNIIYNDDNFSKICRIQNLYIKQKKVIIIIYFR